MNRAVKAGERWSTFIFDGMDCADLGVYAITNGSTYTTNLAPNFTDKKTTVTAYDGQYYYGTQITGQKFTLNMFAENLSYQELSKLKSWLNPRHIGKIIFSDQPFKYYYVKPTSVGALANIPLSDIQTPSNSMLGDYLDGNAVYVGKFTVTFETVGSAYGYGLSYFRDDLVYDALAAFGAENYTDNYFYDSGLLYKDMCPAMRWDINVEDTNAGIEQNISIYNPGDAKSYPRFILNLSNTVEDGGMVHFTNKTTKESCSIDLSKLSGEIVIDFTEQSVRAGAEKKPYYGRMTGNMISISEKDPVIMIPDTVVENIEDYFIKEYDTIYVSNYVKNGEDVCEVTINPLALKVDDSWVDKYFCINSNGGAKIVGVDLKNNLCYLDTEKVTYDIKPAVVDESGVLVAPSGFACNYIEIGEDKDKIPTNPQVGDVYTYQDKWYMYRNGEWTETNLFTSRSQFKNMYGDYITQYLVFGANVVDLDDIVITTTNMPDFEMKAEILPRYI